MEDFPAAKDRLADIPAVALAVRCQEERAFARTNQHSYSSHSDLLTRCVDRVVTGILPLTLRDPCLPFRRSETLRAVSIRARCDTDRHTGATFRLFTTRSVVGSRRD